MHSVSRQPTFPPSWCSVRRGEYAARSSRVAVTSTPSFMWRDRSAPRAGFRACVSEGSLEPDTVWVRASSRDTCSVVRVTLELRTPPRGGGGSGRVLHPCGGSVGAHA